MHGGGDLLVAGAACTAALMLVGCGSNETPAAAAVKPPPATLRKAAPASLFSAGMVTAVSAARTGPANVQVKFELRERPQVASPLDIDLVIVPLAANIDRVSGTVAAGEGLELADGTQIPPADRPPEGIPIAHGVKALPKRSGIFTVTATLAVDAAGVASSQSFAIPVIVGGGLSEAPAKPAAGAAGGGAAKPPPAAR